MELNLELYLVYAVAFRGWPSRVLFRHHLVPPNPFSFSVLLKTRMPFCTFTYYLLTLIYFAH